MWSKTHTHTQSSEACNDGQISHHHRDEWSFCYTQTLTRTHPQFSQADTSIRLILPAYKMLHSSSLNQRCWRHAIFLCFFACSASQIEKPFQWRSRESRMVGFTSRQKYIAEMQGSRRDGQSREAKKDKVVLLCAFLYSSTLQAVDIINISVVFRQRCPLSWLGVLIISVAVRHWKGLWEEKDRQTWKFDHLPC